MQALLRESEEELNITLEPQRLKLIKKFAPASTAYFRCVYLYHCDETPDYNPQDFVSAEWLTPKEMIQKLDDGVAAKASMHETVEAIF